MKKPAEGRGDVCSGPLMGPPSATQSTGSCDVGLRITSGTGCRLFPREQSDGQEERQKVENHLGRFSRENSVEDTSFPVLWRPQQLVGVRDGPRVHF